MPLLRESRKSSSSDGHSITSNVSTKRRFPLLHRKKNRNQELTRSPTTNSPPASRRQGFRVHVQVKFEKPLVNCDHVRDYDGSPKFVASDRICQALLSRLQHCSTELITRHDCSALDPLQKPHRDVKPLRYRITYRVERDGLVLVEKSLRSFQEFELASEDAREVVAATDRIVGLFMLRHDPGFRWTEVADPDPEPFDIDSETTRPCTGRPQPTCCIPRSRFVPASQSFQLIPGYSIELFVRSRCATRYPENRNASVKIDSSQPSPLTVLTGEELTTRVYNLIDDPILAWKRKFDKRHRNCDGLEGSNGCTHVEDGAVDVMVKVRNNLGPDYNYFSHRIQTSKVLFSEPQGRDFDEFTNSIKAKLERARDMTDQTLRSTDDLTLKIRELRGSTWSVHEPLTFRLDSSVTYCRQTVEAIMERLQSGICNVLEGHEDALATMTIHKRGHLIYDGFLDGAGADDDAPREKFLNADLERRTLESRLRDRIRADITMLCKDTCALDCSDELPNLKIKGGDYRSSISSSMPRPPSEVSMTGSMTSGRSDHTLAKKQGKPNLRAMSQSSLPLADLQRVPSGIENAKRYGFVADYAAADEDNLSEPPSTPSLVDTDSISPHDSVVVTPQSSRHIPRDQSNQGLRIIDDGHRVIYQERDDAEAIANDGVEIRHFVEEEEDPARVNKGRPMNTPIDTRSEKPARRSLEDRSPDVPTQAEPAPVETEEEKEEGAVSHEQEEVPVPAAEPTVVPTEDMSASLTTEEVALPVKEAVVTPVEEVVAAPTTEKSVVPEKEQVIPPVEEVVTSVEEQAVPVEEDVIPPVEEQVVPVNAEAVLAKEEDAISAKEAVAPPKEQTIAPIEKVVALVAEEVAVPAKEKDVAPAKEEAVVPKEEQIIPPVEEIVASVEEQVVPVKEDVTVPPVVEAAPAVKNEVVALVKDKVVEEPALADPAQELPQEGVLEYICHPVSPVVSEGTPVPELAKQPKPAPAEVVPVVESKEIISTAPASEPEIQQDTQVDAQQIPIIYEPFESSQDDTWELVEASNAFHMSYPALSEVPEEVEPSSKSEASVAFNSTEPVAQHVAVDTTEKSETNAKTEIAVETVKPATEEVVAKTKAEALLNSATAALQPVEDAKKVDQDEVNNLVLEESPERPTDRSLAEEVPEVKPVKEHIQKHSPVVEDSASRLSEDSAIDLEEQPLTQAKDEVKAETPKLEVKPAAPASEDSGISLDEPKLSIVQDAEAQPSPIATKIVVPEAIPEVAEKALETEAPAMIELDVPEPLIAKDATPEIPAISAKSLAEKKVETKEEPVLEQPKPVSVEAVEAQPEVQLPKEVPVLETKPEAVQAQLPAASEEAPVAPAKEAESQRLYVPVEDIPIPSIESDFEAAVSSLPPIREARIGTLRDLPDLEVPEAIPRPRRTTMVARPNSIAFALEIDNDPFEGSDCSLDGRAMSATSLTRPLGHRRQPSTGFLGLHEQRLMAIGLRNALVPYRYRSLRSQQTSNNVM